MVGRSQENFRVRRPPGRQSGRSQGGRDHEGMCWGACAEKRTNAIGPVERTVRQQQPLSPSGQKTQNAYAWHAGFIALVPIRTARVGKKDARLNAARPSSRPLGRRSRSVPTVALSSAQFNFLLTRSNTSSEETARKKLTRRPLTPGTLSGMGVLLCLSFQNNWTCPVYLPPFTCPAPYPLFRVPLFRVCGRPK